MFALERQKRILELLASDGTVLVSKLSMEMGVTEETIRRDLEKLERQEMLRRTHGGAIPFDENTFELSLEKRKNRNVEPKKNLARAAAQHIVSGDTVFLDASTTTFFISKEIKSMRNLTVITNSMRIVSELAGVEGIKVISVGGVVSNNQSFVGNIAEEAIEKNYFASKMFFSSKGVTADAGILDSNEAESGIKKKMMHNCGKKYYLCDKSKIGRVGFVKIAGFEDINVFITDSEDIENQLGQRLADADVEVIKI